MTATSTGTKSSTVWTERRLVPLAPRTLKRLEAITKGIKTRSGVNVEADAARRLAAREDD
jgi:hypothetical protein